MTLTELINTCGGSQNIQRVLRVDNALIVELTDPALRTDVAMAFPFNDVLSQLSWQPGTPLSEQDWQYLGQIIDTNQRQALTSALEEKPSAHRPLWHIAPPQGLLNDPNGFIYHNGEYHLFYQLHPHGCVHKDKYWAHVTSTDLINWTSQPVALCPSDWFDSHGVFSGHAVSQGDELMLFYTGNVRIGEQRDRITTQCLATSTDGIHFTKHGPVIPELPPGITPHCRDPKVVRHGDHWIMLLGAQHESETGRLVIYRSNDLRKWDYVGLFGEELGDFGYMWECPDLFELNDQLLGILCPQGIESNSEHYTVPHHNGYGKATLSKQDALTLSDLTTLDYGFDFYAPQTAEAADGRRLMVGWMGLPDEINQPSVTDGWLHQLTCLRELSWKNGKLYQRPARELQTLRSQQQLFTFDQATQHETLSLEIKSVELQTTLNWPASGSKTLRLMDDGEHYCDLIVDSDSQRIVLDRSHAMKTDGELIREIKMTEQADIKLQILADRSSLEIFLNDGEYVMSSRFFTHHNVTTLQLLADTKTEWHPVTAWSLAQ
ncbi:sucrose-6-phosphate hydrolase [Photobacterium sp.]|uniref:glycoside hydrolase family 32 protein n=1 Tax=Photobacterium sp. TaxID=660 RepID=UPI00299E77BC|nr:sucrose-6-phosphate hydrolase [Photobacterium sp.]MDX1301376.1 sucrose-6-phosphate hydrolase [Photobacterium sp.]